MDFQPSNLAIQGKFINDAHIAGRDHGESLKRAGLGPLPQVGQATGSQGKPVDLNDDQLVHNMTSAKASTIGQNEMTYFISPSQGERPKRDSKQWSTLKDPHRHRDDCAAFTSNKHQQNEPDSIPALLNQLSQRLRGKAGPSCSQQLFRPGDSQACALRLGAQSSGGLSHSQEQAPVFQQLVLLLQNQIKYNQMKQQRVGEDSNSVLAGAQQMGANLRTVAETDEIREPETTQQPDYRTNETQGDHESQRGDIYSDTNDLHFREQTVVRERDRGSQNQGSPLCEENNLPAEEQPLTRTSPQAPVPNIDQQADNDSVQDLNNTLGIKEQLKEANQESQARAASTSFADQQRSLIDKEQIYTRQHEEGEFILVKQPHSGLCDVQMFSDNFARSTHKKSSHYAPVTSLVKPSGPLKPVHHLISFLQSGIESKRSENPMQELIEQALIKLADDKQTKANGGSSTVCSGSLVSQKMLDHLTFNARSHLLGLADSGMNDSQFAFLIETLEAVLEKASCDGQRLNSKYQIKGLNFNGNHDLTDRSLRLLTDFVQRFRTVKVLSIERLKASHVSLASLFQALPRTRIVELNISGIPINHFCMEQLCKVLSANRSHVDLRVLHLRNTKLSDYCALMLMEHILGAPQEAKQPIDGHRQNKQACNPIKIKYLSLRMNTTLGFDFQNGIIKLLQEAYEGVDRSNMASSQGRRPYHLKFLDLQFCNISQQNQNLIEKYINQNSIDRSNMPNKSQSSHKSKSSKSKYSRSCSVSKSQRKTPSQLMQNNEAIFGNQMFDPRMKVHMHSGAQIVDNPPRPRSTNAEAYRDDAGSSPVDFKQRFRNSFNNNIKEMTNEHIGEIVIRRDIEGGGGSSRRKAYNTGPSARKKGASIISESQLRSIQKFNLDQRGMKLAQSFNVSGTSNSCQKRKLVLDEDHSKMITIKVEEDDDDDQKSQMTANQDVVDLLEVHEQHRIQEEMQALEHGHDPQMNRIDRQMDGPGTQSAIPDDNHPGQFRPQIPSHHDQSRNSFQINWPSKCSKQKKSRNCSLHQLDEKANSQQNNMHFQSKSSQPNADERAMMDQTFQNLTIGQNEGNLQHFQQEGQGEEQHSLYQNEAEANRQDADMPLQYVNSHARFNPLFNGDSPSQPPSGLINQNQEGHHSPSTKHSLSQICLNMRRPTVSSVMSLPENSYSDFDDQHQHSLGLLSQQQRVKDHLNSHFANQHQLDFSRKSLQTAHGERALAAGGSVARFELQGNTLFANSMANLQPYQSQDGSSDANLAFGQSSTHYSDAGNQTREKRGSEHLSNIRQLIDSGSGLVDHGQLSFQGAQSVGHDLSRQLAGGTAGLNAQLLASSGILLKNPKLLHNESIQSLLLQSLHNLKNGQMSACGYNQDQNGLDQSVYQSTNQPSSSYQDPTFNQALMQHLAHQSQSLDQSQNGGPFNQHPSLDLPRSSAANLNVGNNTQQTQQNRLTNTNHNASTPGAVFHRQGAQFNSALDLGHADKSPHVPPSRTCLPSTPHQVMTSTTSAAGNPRNALSSLLSSEARVHQHVPHSHGPGPIVTHSEPRGIAAAAMGGPDPSVPSAPRNQSRTNTAIYNGNGAPQKQQHLGPLSMLIAEQKLRNSTKSNGQSGAGGGKGVGNSQGSVVRKRSTSGRRKRQRMRQLASQQQKAGKKQPQVSAFYDGQIGVSKRKQYSSLQTKSADRRSGYSSKPPSQDNNAMRSNMSENELAYYNQVCENKRGSGMNQNHNYPRFFKNYSTIGKLTSQKLAKNNIKWSVHDHDVEASRRTMMARTKSAGSRDKIRWPNQNEKSPSILLRRPQVDGVTHSTRSIQSKGYSDPRQSSKHTANTRSNKRFKSTKSLRSSSKFGTKRFSMPIMEKYRREELQDDNRAAQASNWQALANNQQQNNALERSFSTHYANNSLDLGNQLLRQYQQMAPSSLQNLDHSINRLFYNKSIPNSFQRITPQPRKSNRSSRRQNDSTISKQMQQRKKVAFSNNLMQKKVDQPSIHAKCKNLPTEDTQAITGVRLPVQSSTEEKNLLGFLKQLKRPNQKGKSIKYIKQKKSPGGSNLAAHQTIQHPKRLRNKDSTSAVDVQSQNSAYHSYKQPKQLTIREIDLQNNFLRGVRQLQESTIEAESKILNLKQNLPLPSIDKLRQDRLHGGKQLDQQMTFENQKVKDGILLGAGEAQVTSNPSTSCVPLVNNRTTQTSRKELTTNSSYNNLQINNQLSGPSMQEQQQNAGKQEPLPYVHKQAPAPSKHHQPQAQSSEKQNQHLPPRYLKPTTDPRLLKLNSRPQCQLVDQHILQQLLSQLPASISLQQDQAENTIPNKQLQPPNSGSGANNNSSVRSGLGKTIHHQSVNSGAKSSVQTTMPSSMLNSYRVVQNSNQRQKQNNNNQQSGINRVQRISGALPSQVTVPEVKLSVADLMSLQRQRQLLAQKSMYQQFKGRNSIQKQATHSPEPNHYGMRNQNESTNYGQGPWKQPSSQVLRYQQQQKAPTLSKAKLLYTHGGGHHSQHSIPQIPQLLQINKNNPPIYDHNQSMHSMPQYGHHISSGTIPHSNGTLVSQQSNLPPFVIILNNDSKDGLQLSSSHGIFDSVGGPYQQQSHQYLDNFSVPGGSSSIEQHNRSGATVGSAAGGDDRVYTFQDQEVQLTRVEESCQYLPQQPHQPTAHMAAGIYNSFHHQPLPQHLMQAGMDHHNVYQQQQHANSIQHLNNEPMQCSKGFGGPAASMIPRNQSEGILLNKQLAGPLGGAGINVVNSDLNLNLYQQQ